MEFAEFAGLEIEHKVDAIWEWGFFLGKSRNSENNRVLYSLNGYFAEMIIDLHTEKVLEVEPLIELNFDKIAQYGLSLNNPFVQLLIE